MHGPTRHGKIGWEREGSGWVTWGYSPNPPTYYNRSDDPPQWLDPRDTQGQAYDAARNLRRAQGLDPITGLPVSSFEERLERRRARLAEAVREKYPRMHGAAIARWVDDYLSRYTRR